MSLDVYLIHKEETICSHCGHKEQAGEHTAYEGNITHNLGNMAKAAGIYDAMWHPEAINATTAADLIQPLQKGLEMLKADPKHFEQFNASNGWGLYKHFVPFVEEYLDACINYPGAEIRVSR